MPITSHMNSKRFCWFDTLHTHVPVTSQINSVRFCWFNTYHTHVPVTSHVIRTLLLFRHKPTIHTHLLFSCIPSTRTCCSHANPSHPPAVPMHTIHTHLLFSCISYTRICCSHANPSHAPAVFMHIIHTHLLFPCIPSTRTCCSHAYHPHTATHTRTALPFLTCSTSEGERRLWLAGVREGSGCRMLVGR